jgi:ribonuclease VapC
MIESYLLDAWAVLAYLKKEAPANQRVIELLELAEQRKSRLAISIINLGEVYYRAGKERGEAIAEQVLRGLQALPIEIVPAETELVLSAARWKMKYSISYADAFAAATAEQIKATLVTGDPELVALNNILKLEILERKN